MNRRPIHEYRCDERPKGKTEGSTHGRQRIQGFLQQMKRKFWKIADTLFPTLDEFYFTTDEKKILENYR